MMRFRNFRNIGLAASALIAAACGDQATPSGPDAAVRVAQVSPRSLLNLGTVNVVNWTGSYKQGQYTASGVVGTAGGSLSIPQADFTITFPAGALSANTSITITSLNGDPVAYDMQPHGIQFAKPVIVTQGLRQVRVPLLAPMFGAYLANDNDLLNNGTALPTEILRSTTLFDLIRGLLTPVSQVWQINHFSRYILASG